MQMEWPAQIMEPYGVVDVFYTLLVEQQMKKKIAEVVGNGESAVSFPLSSTTSNKIQFRFLKFHQINRISDYLIK